MNAPECVKYSKGSKSQPLSAMGKESRVLEERHTHSTHTQDGLRAITPFLGDPGGF